jgi:ABC-2 type transport system ATP-binding protein
MSPSTMEGVHYRWSGIFLTVLLMDSQIISDALKSSSDRTGPERSAINAVGVDKSFGSVHAVAKVNLTVFNGEVVALLGPNGAGKSTLISVLLGLLRQDSGSVHILDLEPGAAVAAGLVGAVLQDGGLMPGVKVRELLGMLGGLYAAPAAIAKVVEMAQLVGLEDRRVDRLSGGQTQRLRVAAALIGNPRLLILDEPTTAMDVEARRAFWVTMRAEAARGTTILFSTHYLEEADAFADRIIVVAKGQVVADGTPRSVKASIGKRVIRFTLADTAINRLAALPGVDTVEFTHDQVTIRSADSDATLRGLLSQWPEASDIEVASIGLEDAFMAITSNTSNGRS